LPEPWKIGFPASPSAHLPSRTLSGDGRQATCFLGASSPCGIPKPHPSSSIGQSLLESVLVASAPTLGTNPPAPDSYAVTAHADGCGGWCSPSVSGSGGLRRWKVKKRPFY
jgi:hypothetical protein